MITVIREKAKSRWFRGLLLLIVFSMTIGGSFFVPGFFRQVSQEAHALIVVNGHSISPSRFAMKAQQEHERLEMFRKQFGNQADMFLRMMGLENPQKVAYESLVQETLVDQAASTISLPLDENFIIKNMNNPSFVMQELMGIVPMYVLDHDGTINPQALGRYLQHNHMTMTDFEHMIEQALQRSTLLGLLQTTAYVGSNEIRERFIEQYVPKNFAVLHFKGDNALQKARKLSVTDEELKAFFLQENKTHKRYWAPETRTGVVWEFSPQHFNISASSEDVEKYYTKNKDKKYVQSAPKLKLRRILLKIDDDEKAAEVRNKILQLKNELDKDSSLFESYAKQHSQDSKTASQGGLLPWYTQDELKPLIADAVFKLADGGISEPLKTEEGYELMQRVERKPKEFKPLAEVKQEIEKTLRQQRFSGKFNNMVKQKITLKTPENSLAELKKTYQAQEKALISVAPSESRINQELFKLKKGDFASYVDNDKGFVVLLNNVTKTHASEFDTIKDRVKNDWYAHKAELMMQEDLQKAEQGGIEAASKEFNLSIEQLEGLLRQDAKSTESWSKKGYPVEEFLRMTHVGQVQPFKKGKDSFLVKVVSQGSFNEALFAQHEKEIARQLYQEARERLQRGFVASLRRNATIKTSDEFNNMMRNLPQ